MDRYEPAPSSNPRRHHCHSPCHGDADDNDDDENVVSSPPRRDRSILALSSEENNEDGDEGYRDQHYYSSSLYDAENGQATLKKKRSYDGETIEETSSSHKHSRTPSAAQFTVVTPAARPNASFCSNRSMKQVASELSGGGGGGGTSSQAAVGAWLCRPYAREKLLEDIYTANRKGLQGHEAILDTLQSAGVMIYIVDSKVATTKADVMDSVRSVVLHVSKIARAVHSSDPRDYQRCLLYRDREGRFFNLTLSGHTTSSVGKWQDYLDSFSGLQAMAILTIMCRSFACTQGGMVENNNLAPAYLVLLLGLVFGEEIGLSWTNVAMFVRGVPSISAFSLMSPMESDWFRKVIIFTLAIGSFAEGRGQTIVTLLGISMACAALLANLGSRAWRFCGFRPMVYAGPVEPVVAYFLAMCVGALFPYLGHRQVEAGGKAAMESVMRISFLVAVIFIISGFEQVQQFLILGTEVSRYYRTSKKWDDAC